MLLVKTRKDYVYKKPLPSSRVTQWYTSPTHSNSNSEASLPTPPPLFFFFCFFSPLPRRAYEAVMEAEPLVCWPLKEKASTARTM